MSKKFHVFHVGQLIRSAVIILFPLLVGGLAALITRNSMVYYQVLVKPPLAPPGFIFPIVWTILYLLMGISLWLVLRKGYQKPYVKDAVNYFLIQLALSFLWPIVFFNLQAPLFAFLILLCMWIFLGICIAKFYRISHVAGWLLVPAWLWTTFAGYLNLAVWLLNR